VQILDHKKYLHYFYGFLGPENFGMCGSTA
jgi:hypothetical protein